MGSPHSPALSSLSACSKRCSRAVATWPFLPTALASSWPCFGRALRARHERPWSRRCVWTKTPIASPTITSAWAAAGLSTGDGDAATRPGDARRQLPVVRRRFRAQQDFVKTLKEHYWAEVQTLDFRAPDSARKVNAWANEKTRGRIPAVVDSLEPFSPLVTMNACTSKDYGRSPSR